MRNFSDSLKSALNNKQEKTLTENGAVAYKQTKHTINDMAFNLAELRNSSFKKIGEQFAKVFYEEGVETSCKFFFWVSDILEGAGERNVTKGIMKWIAENYPDKFRKIVKFIPKYNRWDTLILAADPQFNGNRASREAALDIIKLQFIEDLRKISTSEYCSLLAKWMPSENASSKETRRRARQLMEDLNITPRNYRHGLAMLRNKLHVVECDMSANNWGDIKYEHVPSKANLKYANAFFRHDEERRKEYLTSLAKGETKINSKTLAPYEIVRNYKVNHFAVKSYDEVLEQLWKNLPKYQLKNTLVVRDGSGSMTDRCTGNTTCLDVATAVAIYAAEHNSKEWKNKFITFSSHPEFVDMSHCEDLHSKLKLCNRYDDCSNTDMYATMKLILDVARKNRYTQAQMPETILIISDMAFDAAPTSYYTSFWKYEHGRFNYDETLFQTIQREYRAAGYKLPKVVFWNVNARGTTTVPIQENELGMGLVSGFSTNIFKMVMSNKLDPYEQLMEILNSERYKPVEKALQAK